MYKVYISYNMQNVYFIHPVYYTNCIKYTFRAFRSTKYTKCILYTLRILHEMYTSYISYNIQNVYFIHPVYYTKCILYTFRAFCSTKYTKCILYTLRILYEMYTSYISCVFKMYTIFVVYIERNVLSILFVCFIVHNYRLVIMTNNSFNRIYHSM